MSGKYLWALLASAACAFAGSGVAGVQAQSDSESCGDKPVAIGNPYKVSYFDNDFSYLKNPCLADHDRRNARVKATDSFKGVQLGPNTTIDLGGSFRLRYHHEQEMARTRLAGLDNDFTLSQLRVYANLDAGSHFRGYVEIIDARSYGENFPPRGIEVDRFDLVNAFVELRAKAGNGKVYARVGRQELNFGAQRLISPLPWGNTRRVFDGGRANYTDKTWRIDGWWVSPRVVNPKGYNETNNSFSFKGVYASYLGIPGTQIDAYIFGMDEDGAGNSNIAISTAGSRAKGKTGGILWEVEGAVQWGDTNAGGDHSAQMFLFGVGKSFAGELPGNPTIWIYYDWASGDKSPTNGKTGTFRQAFPLGHAYFGFMDLVGRQNVSAISIRTGWKLTPKLGLNVHGHKFSLSSSRDALYNAGGGAIRRDASGASGSNIGTEVDITMTYPLAPRFGLLVGFSQFWGGSFVDNTNPAGAGLSGNASFFYVQSQVQF